LRELKDAIALHDAGNWRDANPLIGEARKKADQLIIEAGLWTTGPRPIGNAKAIELLEKIVKE